jgi:hypothetical protein
MLTDEQKNHFKTFGFLVLRQVLTPEEIDEIRRESDRILLENRQGEPFPGTKRQAMIPFFEHSPALLRYMEDDRIYHLGTDLLGPGFVLNATEGNLHVGDTQWHGGGPEAEVVPHIKIAFYLEPTTKDSGALRLIPGSNFAEIRQRLQPLTAQNDDPSTMPFGVSGPDLPCQVFESEPGDIGIFSEHTWHAAFGGKPGRSQHAINFMANPTTDEQVTHLRNLYESWTYSLHPPEVLINSDRPRLRGMVEKLVELGFEPPPPFPIFCP